MRQSHRPSAEMGGARLKRRASAGAVIGVCGPQKLDRRLACPAGLRAKETSRGGRRDEHPQEMSTGTTTSRPKKSILQYLGCPVCSLIVKNLLTLVKYPVRIVSG